MRRVEADVVASLKPVITVLKFSKGKIAAMKLLRRFKIAALKRKAKNAYLNYQNAVTGLSCGSALAEQVSGAVLAAKLEFNSCMDKLSALDPATPIARL